jgi:hypothetical protein
VRVVTTDLSYNRFPSGLSYQQAQTEVVATPVIDRRGSYKAREPSSIHHDYCAANCESLERHSRGGEHKVVSLEAIMEIVNLGSEGAADLIEL